MLRRIATGGATREPGRRKRSRVVTPLRISAGHSGDHPLRYRYLHFDVGHCLFSRTQARAHTRMSRSGGNPGRNGRKEEDFVISLHVDAVMAQRKRTIRTPTSCPSFPQHTHTAASALNQRFPSENEGKMHFPQAQPVASGPDHRFEVVNRRTGAFRGHLRIIFR